jgi:hypothetical protein
LTTASRVCMTRSPISFRIKVKGSGTKEEDQSLALYPEP